MKRSVVLKGITWGHSRGLTPLLAASQRYHELHPEITIEWSVRSLQQFADFPIEKLTEQYDLLVIDHPWVGCAAATACVLPLNEYLSASFLQDQLQNSVGHSHESYFYGGGQWGLAIDAATPVASFRKDLLEKNGVQLPQTWQDVITLAKAGRVAVPAIPIDLLMNFYTFCIAAGEKPFGGEEKIVSKDIGVAAIRLMKELYSAIDKRFFTCNPIAVAELMSTTDEFWYCPFAYGYSNYSRGGYAKKLLHYTDVVACNGEKLKTTLGGTGLAVSASSTFSEAAIHFAQMVASGECQRTLYVQHGGQPGHRSAWQDDLANSITHDYFHNTIAALDRSYMRPRYNGYLYFQDHAGQPLHDCLVNNGNEKDALDQMNALYQESLTRTLTTTKA